MADPSAMIDVQHQRQRIFDAVPRMPSTVVDLASAAGHTVVSAVHARSDLPPWDNSAMDGYAVRCDDVAEASESNPVTLEVIGEVAAGSAENPELPTGSAVAIMTGAPVPDSADTIIPVEDVLGWDPKAPTAGIALPGSITVTSPVVRGKHIRRRAEDVHAGDEVISPGEMLSAHSVGAAASAGASRLCVAARPRVVVVATGDELVDPGTALGHGMIPDSNSFLVAEQVHKAGAEVVYRGRVGDGSAELAQLLEDTAGSSDAVVLTGGASVGAHDVSREVLSQRGVRFNKVKMQPGKPQGFGVLDDGRPVWVLPGNPVSVLVSTVLFVRPGLETMQSRTEVGPWWQRALVDTGWTPTRGRDQYLPVRTVSNNSEPLTVAPAHGRGSGSHLAARLAQASGLVHVPTEIDEVSPGDTVLHTFF